MDNGQDELDYGNRNEHEPHIVARRYACRPVIGTVIAF